MLILTESSLQSILCLSKMGGVFDKFFTEHGEIFSCVLYGSLSFGLTILNKIVMTRFQFEYATVIMMLQMFLSLILMEGARLLSIIKVAPYSFERGKEMFLPSALYCLHSYFALTALHGMNLPMYGAIKRCVPLISLYFGVFFLGKHRPSCKIVLGVCMIVLGAIMAGSTDLNFDYLAYIYGGLAVLFQAAYLTMIELLSTKKQFTAVEMTYINSFNGLAGFMICDLFHDEIKDAYMFFRTTAQMQFYVVLVLLLFVGVFLNFSVFLVTVTTDAVMTSIVGNIKAIFQTILGFFLGMYVFMDVSISIYNIFGILINLSGFAFYTYVKHGEKPKNDSQAKISQISSTSSQDNHNHIP